MKEGKDSKRWKKGRKKEIKKKDNNDKPTLPRPTVRITVKSDTRRSTLVDMKFVMM
jgi:hypothetical protein